MIIAVRVRAGVGLIRKRRNIFKLKPMETAGNGEVLQSSPPEEEKKVETMSPEGRSGSHHGSSERHSQDKLSRSKLQYEADPEDVELRQKLLESKMARKKTEEDAKVLMNRLLLLKNEEQKVVVVAIP